MIRLERLLLSLCVVVSGAGVMIYEFLAVRILARFFGSALEVWASEISVCLAGLAIGYSVGGYLADRFQSMVVLGLWLILGGISGFGIEPLALFMGETLLEVDTGLKWHPFLAALVSSSIPFVALGTVVPQAIRLRALSLEEVGATSGRMGALSTVGSIAGVLLTAMVLLPRWGVRTNLWAVSCLLVLMGIGLVFRFRRRRNGSLAILFLSATLLYGGSCRADTVVLDRYSAYHHILVRDSSGTRSLFFDNAEQSRMSLADPDSGAFEYTDFFHLPVLFDPEMCSVFFVGLGGGSGPKSFLRNHPNMGIEVAEIDPEVTRVAEKYFSLPEDPRLEISPADGRAYLRRARGPFGAIVIDAYATGRQGVYLPYHLATQEFFRLARGKLASEGCVVFNVMGKYGGPNDSVVRTLLVTLESVFSKVYAFEAKTSFNTVFVAVKTNTRKRRTQTAENGKLQHPLSTKKLRKRVEELRAEGVFFPKDFEVRVSQKSRVLGAPRTTRVLTDDFSPIDLTIQSR